jgi:predicted Zn finger-like uncharacterized protein
MNIRILCPSCQAACNVKEEQVGKRVRCPRCKAAFTAEADDPPSERIVAERRPSRPAAPSNPPSTRRRPPDDEEDDRRERRRRPDDEEDVAPRRRRAVQDRDEDDDVRPRRRMNDDDDDDRPRRKPAPPPRKKSSLGLILIIGGVVGSLAIGGVVLMVVVFWNLSGALTGSDAGVENRVVAGPMFPPPDPDEGKKGDDNKSTKTDTKPRRPLPPPPKTLEFVSASPISPAAANQPPAPANGQLGADVLQRVKGATVFLWVHMPDGDEMQGSGFFGVEPDVILTNAHVVGMLYNDGRRPKTIEVFRNSGTPEEKKYSAEVLGVDRSADLAVLRIKAPGAPPPLEVKSAQSLHETQQVWVIGFPFGSGLGKEVTVSSSSVSSIRRDHGLLSKVQVNGGMQPGNSGGPVVDAYGNVIGVAVSMIRNTQINFAVPGDSVHMILNGRVGSLTVGQPYIKDGATRVRVTMRTVDPLARIRQPAIDVWAGDASPNERAASLTAPAVPPGDSPHLRYPLEYHDEVARGEITLPAAGSGKAIWIQPVWRNTADALQWTSAHVVELPAPVEQRPGLLAVKHHLGSHSVVVNNWGAIGLRRREGGEGHMALNTEASMTETTEAVDKDDSASSRLQYRDFNHEMHWENRLQPPDKTMEKFRSNLGKVVMNLRIDKQGNIVSQQDLTPLVQLGPGEIADLQEQFGMVRMLAIPLPNKLVAPDESWTAQRPVSAHVMREGWLTSGNLDMTYTYIGTRKAGTREEAVLSLEGQFPKRKKNESHMTGRAEGTAVVDLATGQANRVDLVIFYDFDVNQFGEITKSHGTLTLRLQRDATPVVAGK